MKKYFVLIIVISLCCCKNRTAIHEPDIKVLKIEIDKYIKDLDVSQFYNASFIPLELTKDSQIGKIDKVIINDEMIFVLDNSVAKKLFVFDLKGKFIRTIGGFGQAQGEYILLSDFEIYKDKIYLSSRQNNKMLIFDIDGKHLKDVKFSGFIGLNFHVLDGGFLVNATDGSNKAATFYNNKGKKQKIITNPEVDFMRYLNFKTFFKYKDGSYMYFAKNDTIYRILDKKLIASLILNFGEKSIPYGKMESKKMLEKYMDNNAYLELTLFYTFPKYYFAELAHNSYLFKAIIDKSSEVVYYSNSLTYNGFPLLDPVGYTFNGPILLWGPPSHIMYNGISSNDTITIPKQYSESTINANPGIVILTEK